VKPGYGAGILLFDAQRLTRSQIRERWKAGEYGPPGERPRADHVDGWLKLLGK
jgi:hypothetical protein